VGVLHFGQNIDAQRCLAERLNQIKRVEGYPRWRAEGEYEAKKLCGTKR